ncbi:MAG TPA: hypothetical protein VMB71_00090 [Acetobacteraceae bacterium]|nr:hypothetical protein [Acetobacteraceae bacterium]
MGVHPLHAYIRPGPRADPTAAAAMAGVTIPTRDRAQAICHSAAPQVGMQHPH